MLQKGEVLVDQFWSAFRKFLLVTFYLFVPNLFIHILSFAELVNDVTTLIKKDVGDEVVEQNNNEVPLLFPRMRDIDQSIMKIGMRRRPESKKSDKRVIITVLGVLNWLKTALNHQIKL